MAGLFGYVSQRPPCNPLDIVAAMGERMRHHDYYRIDTAVAGPSCGLGRLGLNLLNAGPQPLHNADGSVVLTLCGEFYYREPGQSDDAEYAVNLYLSGGID